MFGRSRSSAWCSAALTRRVAAAERVNPEAGEEIEVALALGVEQVAPLAAHVEAVEADRLQHPGELMVEVLLVQRVVLAVPRSQELRYIEGHVAPSRFMWSRCHHDIGTPWYAIDSGLRVKREHSESRQRSVLVRAVTAGALLAAVTACGSAAAAPAPKVAIPADATPQVRLQDEVTQQLSGQGLTVSGVACPAMSPRSRRRSPRAPG